MKNKNSILSVLADLPNSQKDFQHAESVLAAASDSTCREITFDPLSKGAPCSELFDLYEFRLKNLDTKDDAMRNDLECLVRGLPNDATKRCHIAVVEIEDLQYSLFLSKGLDRVYGCLKHSNQDPRKNQ